ncbi:hypothetical protein PCO85_04430 [Prodigiosinella aquatilis]|nr:hypothetical protein [Prodigiosinella sp. LS101]WJV54697.1 hypothetical protein PCO85_04430 [Prodigiosinella sp. LS101]WJV59060.1 hypothetical protein PCO84_04445 [Pectobacteriaceae bacterium C111]
MRHETLPTVLCSESNENVATPILTVPFFCFRLAKDYLLVSISPLKENDDYCQHDTGIIGPTLQCDKWNIANAECGRSHAIFPDELSVFPTG